MNTDTRTMRQRVIDAELKEIGEPDLATLVATKRHEGMSWEAITFMLNGLIGSELAPNYSTLYRWFASTEAAA